MEFVEKLDRLTAGRREEISKAAGLPAFAISNYISKRQMPRGDRALALARALHVPIDWLLDNDRDFPPPEQSSLANVDDARLMYEALRRQRLEAMRVRELIERAKTIDWAEVRKKLDNVPRDSEVPGEILAEMRLALSLSFATLALDRYDASKTPALIGELPGADQPYKMFDVNRLHTEMAELNSHNKDCREVQVESHRRSRHLGLHTASLAEAADASNRVTGSEAKPNRRGGKGRKSSAP